jgi:hypothetical protein
MERSKILSKTIHDNDGTVEDNLKIDNGAMDTNLAQHNANSATYREVYTQTTIDNPQTDTRVSSLNNQHSCHKRSMIDVIDEADMMQYHDCE